ncbi:MAG: TonB-dependent receptor [Candidatus Marinimicrobia bacterium]|nr:TonB-dependent receptor [Candidatus Neomarinimicrobiota bacterium]
MTRSSTQFLTLITALFIVSTQFCFGQTTGKISGSVTDKSTGDPLPGANIFVPNTYMGTVADENGLFYLINVLPGDYTLKVSMIGYAEVTINDVHISINRTTSLNLTLDPTVLEGTEVIVEVDRVSVKKDQTGTIKNVSSDQIEALPIEDLSAVVAMQAGVVEGHFRGGRLTEVSYMIDGMQVDEVFGGTSSSVSVEPEVVQDLEVITGTFNAEYGRAMSGIVNAVTKDGSNHFDGSASIGMGNYYTPNDNIFIGLDPGEFDRNKDYKFQISGPAIPDIVNFFANIRVRNNKNHLNGINRYRVDDLSNYYSDNPAEWITEANGDGEYASMNGSENTSLLGKLTFSLFKSLRSSFLYTKNEDIWSGYNHTFKYNPNGMASTHRTTDFYALQFNHMLSNRLFYELKLSRMDSYSGWYVFKNPLDSNYVHDKYLESYGVGFFTGGQEKGHSERFSLDDGIKFDLTWQINQRHNLKFGGIHTTHQIDSRWHEIRNKYSGNDNQDDDYEPIIFGDSTGYADVYKVSPVELSGYAQDKMEFDNMVINIGLRYDWFDPKTTYPSDRRNPANQLSLPDSMMSTYPKAGALSQISPRLGLAYQLGSAAVLHFSYGHFFQMPPMYAMYQNHSLLVGPSDYSTTMGNPLLKPEKTVTYEIGLWQELTRDMGIEVSLFYRDIYNLLSTKIISTYNQIEYGLYSNKDYGNARGLEVKYDLRFGDLSANVNYTLQYTRGNADYPTQAFDRSGNSQDPVNRFIPMSWDQRHTLNTTIGYYKEQYGISLTGYYNSGTPYTFSPLEESILSRINLYPNNDYMPSRYTVDMTGHYNMSLGGLGVKFTLSVYNLFDRLNEVAVDSRTGRAYTAIVRDSDFTSHHSNFNTLEDIIRNPSMFATPRMIKLSAGVNF